MIMPKAFWEDNNGLWTTASLIVREICHSKKFDKELKTEELYYILDTLGVKKLFADYWDHPEFYTRANMAYQAIDKVDKTRDGWLTKKGDLAWAAGDEQGARRFYEESIKKGDSTWSGYGGMFRLHFSHKEFAECVNIFRMVCPPHSFYTEFNLLLGRSREDGFNFNKATEFLDNKYNTTSPFFISRANYMLKAVVYASINSSGINNALQEMICDYFETSVDVIQELASSLLDNEREYAHLKIKVEPKPQKTSNKLEDLIVIGASVRAKEIYKNVLNYEEVICDVKKALEKYLQTGHEAHIDNIIYNPHFSISGADRIIYDIVLESLESQICQMPERQLYLMRRFSPLCYYPKISRVFVDGEWRDSKSFIEMYYELITKTNTNVLPDDIILCFKKINWWENNLDVDYNFIMQYYEWCSIILEGYANSFDIENLKSPEKAVDALYDAYKYMYRRYQDVKNRQTWVNEEMLMEAIANLFGKENVQQHASPLWLCPQHFDIYLPGYNLAIEYMGIQHYEAIDEFGGEKGLNATRERDKRKADVCDRMKVDLVYVTYEEDIGKRAREIFELYGT